MPRNSTMPRLKTTEQYLLRMYVETHCLSLLSAQKFGPASSGGGEDAGAVHWRSLLDFFNAAARAG